MDWRTLSWLPGYEISENGDLRRTRKIHSHPAGRPLRGSVHCKGYLRYCVRVDGVKRYFFAQRLVCEAWHGGPPFEGAQAAHGDGNKANNHWSNLRWATCADNHNDMVSHGTAPVGERHGMARLNWQQVREIRATFAAHPPRLTAEKYGVTTSAIRAILKGITWAEAA